MSPKALGFLYLSSLALVLGVNLQSCDSVSGRQKQMAITQAEVNILEEVQDENAAIMPSSSADLAPYQNQE